MNLFKRVRWGFCFTVALVVLFYATLIYHHFNWPVIWGIYEERFRLDEQLRVVQEVEDRRVIPSPLSHTEDRRAIPSSPSLPPRKGEGGE